MWGWRDDGSTVKSTGYFFRGPRFNYQHPHATLQLSVTPVQRIWPPCADLHADTTLVHTKINLKTKLGPCLMGHRFNLTLGRQRQVYL